MRKQNMTVLNKNGIHARPAALIAQTMGQFNSNIDMSCNGNTVNAKSIMGVITLGAANGTEVSISADGSDENEAVDALSQLFQSGFQE